MANRVFCEIAFTDGMQDKKHSLGMIDLAFAGPELTDTGEKKPDLPDLLAVMNLHGDANDEKLKAQLDFIKQVSQLIVVIPEDSKQLENAKFAENQTILVVHDLEKINFNLKKPERDEFNFLKPNGQLLGNRQFLTVRNKINKLIETNCLKETWKSLEEIAEFEWKNLHVDFKYSKLNDAKKEAEDLFGDMTVFCKINALVKTQQISEEIAKARLLKYHF